ncbi:hypothetical protein DAEQUDRAFT_810471 [Daedalea quercina L-15889]|uniref:Yeast cell wall synthesis Kre9/Knh1-like N-terminal domain-containing protein n=1 Tax=Daedalea quercina L-15889 TaxID=1314783 RepID=A0A165RC93_9APHY|nr:hypothetical protein DAEQUDRAFT_810471 [Daedalea quercina L-15889]
MLRSSIYTLLLVVSSVAASLYPTRPIANTVFSAGRMSTITWINDDTQPSVSQMGPVRIDLFSGDDNYVATLAQNIEPSRRSKSVWISPTLGPNASDYHLRFICEDPPVTVYTARFALVAMDDTPAYHRAGKLEPRSTSTAYLTLGSSATSSPASFATIPMSLNSTTVSTSPSRMPSSTVRSSYAIPTSTSNPYRQQTQNSAGSSGSWKRGTVDMERLKFRLVFILWPFLIGMTLAL